MDWMQKNNIFCKKIGIIIGVYLGMKYLVPLVIPFLIALVVVRGFWPCLERIKKRFHIRPPVTMAFFLLVTAAFLAGGFYLVGRKAGGSLWNLCRGLDFQEKMESLLYDCCDGVGEMLHLESERLRVFVTEQLRIIQAQTQQKLLPEALGGSWQAVKKVGSLAAAFLVAVVSMLLLASDYERIRETARSWPYYRQIARTFHGILHSAGGYLKAQGILMGIVMLICIAGIWISGWISGNVGSPVLAGIGTGLLDALPVFGTGTVFLPWVFIKVVQKEYLAAVVLAGTYGLCVMARELLEPKLVGDKLGVLPVVILISVYVGVKLYGAGGILLGPLSVLLIRELWKQVEKAEKHTETGG